MAVFFPNYETQSTKNTTKWKRFFKKSFIYTGTYIRPRSFFNVNMICRQVTSSYRKDCLGSNVLFYIFLFQNGLDEMPLFEPALLRELDWESRKATFKNDISNTNPGESLIIRPLCSADYDRGKTQRLFTHILS